MEVEEDPDVVAFAGRALPACFHFEGQFANSIVDCHGECSKISTEVRVVDDPNGENSAKLYYQYIAKYSNDMYACSICSQSFSARDKDRRSASNIIKHIKKSHPEVIPFNFMPEAFITKKTKEWEAAIESAKKAKKRKEPERTFFESTNTTNSGRLRNKRTSRIVSSRKDVFAFVRCCSAPCATCSRECGHFRLQERDC